MLDGRVKTLHPKVHGGILARRDVAGASRRAGRARHPDDRPRRRQPLSVSRNGRASPAARSTTRSRTSTSAARRWCAPPRRTGRTSASSSIPPTTPPLLAELRDATATRCRMRTRFRLARRRSRTRLRTTARSPTGSTARDADGAPQAFPQSRSIRRRQSCRMLRYGENPHQRAAFYRDDAPPPGSDRHVPAAAGQGAVVQQHRRRRRRVGMREDVRRAGVRDRQARATRAASRVAATPLDAYRSALATDPTSAFGGIIAFNRAGRRRDARGGRRAVRRSADRARLHRGRAGRDRAEEERARARSRRCRYRRAADASWISSASAAGFLVQIGRRRATSRRDELTRRDAQGADAARRSTTCCSRGASRSSSSRMRSSIARAARTLGIGAGQMSRVDSTRIAAIKAAQRAGLSLAGSVVASGRVLPVPRRPRRRRRQRRRRGDPARRQRARRRGDRRRRRARPGDGLHRDSTFSPMGPRRT